MNEEWVVSGSYDSIVKIWNRKTGAFIGDLTGGHTGRVFGIGFDCTKVVSVGEDQVRDCSKFTAPRDAQAFL
jgi:F-box and WD-40 domain protein 1/11